MEVPEAAFTVSYLVFLLSVTITTLGLLFLGSMARSIRRRKHASFKKKVLLFPLFIVGILAVGWFSERLQQGVYAYIKQNAATSVSGILLAVLVAWLLYDWVLWR